MTICPEVYKDLSNTISYKGFTGIINYCNSDNILYGCVISGIPDMHSISYHGNTIEECIQAFQDMIEDYMEEDRENDSALVLPA